MPLLEFLDFSNIHCIIAIFISLANAVLLVFVARKFFQILQISGYKIRGYSLWLKDTKAKYISRITMLAFLSLCCVLVTNFLFDVYNSEAIYSYFGLIFYIYFTIVFVVNANKAPQKTPLVQTRRMSRLTTLLFIISFVITFILIWLATFYLPSLRFGIIVLTPILTPILVPLVHFVLAPLENLIRISYIIKAKKKLAKRTDLVKIGITGSYGKTSVKYILNKMLGQKFNVCITPHSFNTPMGLTKVILKYLKKDNQILIAEMGAKQQGDIKYLCDFIHPDHAIITGIGTQHYETFGSAENIAKTKYELVESLPKTANAIFNIDSEECKKLYEKCPLKNKFAISVDGKSEVVAKNAVFSTHGIAFDLSYKNELVHCKTTLLGKHNLQNILMASCLALKLGVSLEEISYSLIELEPITHRLEPIKNGNIIVLDDAYSSNEEGAKSALEVLSLYTDYIKVCITPGIVEMGAREFETNENYGKQLGAICDYIIIVNKVNEEALRKGIFSTKILPENVFFVENLELAKQKFTELSKTNKRFVVLFGNDLPDNYT